MAPQCRLAILLGLVLAGSCRGAEATVTAPANLITNVAEFWNIPEAEKKKPQPVNMELIVYHYELGWNLLYGQTGQAASYLPVHGRAMPIKTGQKVRLVGTVIPAEGFDGDRIKVTLLADDALPEPLSTAGRMEDFATLNGQWVLLEGYVLQENELDPTHVEARLWCEGRVVSLTLQISGTGPVPQLLGARVRLRGVYDMAKDAAGGIQRIMFWSSERGQLEVTGWLNDDERFKLPRTPIERLASAAGKLWVRIVGEVKNRETGTGLNVQDETGQVEIDTTQPGAFPSGTMIELIGRVGRADVGWTLKEPLVRRLDGPGVSAGMPSGVGPVPMKLRLAEQILQLTPDEAEKRVPVSLHGVVTWADDHAGHFYLQDLSGGVAVTRPPGTTVDFGAVVTVTGVTVRGRSMPAVEPLAVDSTGTQPLPPPRRISLDQALGGVEEGRWVEMRGYVRQVASSEGWTRLDLIAVSGEFSAYFPPSESLQQLQGAMVRLRGVCEARPGANGVLPDVRLWVQNRDGVSIDEGRPTDIFTAPARTVANLRQQAGAETVNHRVRLTGQVQLHVPGRYLYLEDASGGILVLTRETKPLKAGEWIELVGFPGRTGSRLVLREPVWRPSKAEPEIAPQPLANADMLKPEVDARLVRFPALLRQVVNGTDGATLTLQAGDFIIEAVLHETANWSPPEPGSVVEVTGVYVLEFDEYRRPHGFGLELRTPADIVLREAPPWWTMRRTFYGVGALAVCILLAFGWVIFLRRQVRSQTEQIRHQLENEARLQAELERSSRLESLGVLAGGIAHDFNNLLTAILGNLGLAAMDKRVMAAAGDCISEAERGARRAADITQQLLTFAKGGDPIRAAVSLPEVLTEAANFARHGSKVRLDFDFPPDLPPGDVDAGQISRVMHNLVINAVQAMPEGGIVSSALAAVDLADNEVGQLPAGHYLRLTVADTGTGIPSENLVRIFDPYFSTKAKNSGLGLATVRSIVKKHFGHIEVESNVGRGTAFRLWLPTARPAPPSPQAAVHPVVTGPVRILVLDDEEVIRRVAGRMLSLAGHEVVFAADGAEAVRAYFAARSTGHAFDLVIFDLTVPGGMGGKDALQEILRNDPGVRGVASSGYSNDPVMANPATFGFRSCLLKPYDIPDLVRAINEARQN